MIRRMRACFSLTFLGIALAASGEPALPIEAVSDGTAGDRAREILMRSFEQRHDFASAQRVRMVRQFKAQREVLVMEVVQKFIDERMHRIVRIEEPEEYRGWRVLTIEAVGRSDDHFLFMRSHDRVRRVRANPSDAFFGTDFTLEDMERRAADDFDYLSLSENDYDGEPVFVVVTRPRYSSQSARVEFVIAKSDQSQLAVRFFRQGASTPSKEVLSPRDSIRLFEGRPIPTHIIARNTHRKTETHAYAEKVVVDPDIADRFFSVRSLLGGNRIPALEPGEHP